MASRSSSSLFASKAMSARRAGAEREFSLAELRRLAPVAVMILALVGALLVGGGAYSAAQATAVSAAIAFAALIVLAAAKPEAAAAAVRAHRIALAAALLFVFFAMFTTAPLAGPWSHPIFAQTGLAPGPASLAPYKTWEGLAAFMGPLAAFAAGALATRRKGDRDRVGLFLVVAGIAYALWSLGVYFAGLGPGRMRLDSGIGSANISATVFALFALLAIARVARAVQGRRAKGAPAASLLAQAPASLALLTVALCALLLTQSRGGLLAFLAGAIVLAALLWAGGAQKAMGVRAEGAGRALAVVGGLMLAILLFGVQETWTRLVAAPGDDAGRAAIFAPTWQAFLDRPWLGHGLGAFFEINLHYAEPDTFALAGQAGAAHNVVLQHAAETGLVGLALFAAMLGPVIWRAFRGGMRPSSRQPLQAFAAAASVTVLLHGMVDFSLNVVGVAALFAFMLGLFSRD